MYLNLGNFIQLFGALMTLLIITPVNSQDSSCVNPIGQSGYCTNIRQCRTLLELLRTHGNAVGDFLRSSVCGYDNYDPKVCCPDGRRELNPQQPDIFPNKPDPQPTSPPRPTSTYGPLLSPECGIANTTYTRIVGGVPAKLGAWPWIAALGYRSAKNSNQPQWLCGGSLISSRHVLTAGHCVHRRKDLYLVRLGDLDLYDDNDGATPINVVIETVNIHPQYSPSQYTNDIAVLRLQNEVQFTDHIRPICLPIPNEVANRDYVETLPFIAGWGSVYFRGPSAAHLQQLQIPVVSPQTCKTAFQRFKTAVIDDRVFCAGYAKGGKDACQGDSGGPLMFPSKKTFYVIGVVSYGYRCAEPGIPGVYTKTSQFLDFVMSHLN
ncbi:hypothetical protein PV327_000525 [Microctonus hyperodae]|uniref:CLIP domain-containing serine protease n=1 Tax=Microctonus hyperodae TaxID=165561 RepID=A0AA39L224_MICHY|nr:hypothetical protein PV327_000525 [Microctonus hyperodae]